jgi:hypothetical protein
VASPLRITPVRVYRRPEPRAQTGYAEALRVLEQAKVQRVEKLAEGWVRLMFGTSVSRFAAVYEAAGSRQGAHKVRQGSSFGAVGACGVRTRLS